MVKTVLVIECTENYNWYERFAGAKLHNKEEIKVEQASWQDISVVSYPDTGAVVTLRRAKQPLPNTPQANDRTIKVDFILLRSVSRGINNLDSRNLLLGFIHQNIPAVNTLQSAYLCCERPTSYGALLEIQSRLGKEKFPLIPQTYYSSYKEMLISPDTPFVCKVAHAQSGFGKFRITQPNDFGDFRSVCAIHGDYVTAEPFIQWDWDGRVQKIGSNYRAFKRTSSNWKGNVGNQSVVEEIEVEAIWKEWADECSKIFGGLDILGLDFLHCAATGKYYILEVNDTAIGLVHKVAEEDMEHMKNLALMRMEQAFPNKNNNNNDNIINDNNNDDSNDNNINNDDNLEFKLKQAREEIAQLKISLNSEKQKNAQMQQKLDEVNAQKKSSWRFW